MIHKLFELGHFWSPEAMAVGEVDVDDLDKLTTDDRVVEAAVRSYQGWFEEELNVLTKEWHGRESIADGDVGPATVALLDLPRCGVPDFQPADADAAGNWPDSCRSSISTSFRMTLRGVPASRAVAWWQEGDDNWNRALDVAMRVNQAAYPNTRVHAVAESMRGGILAYQQLAVSRCNVRLRGAFNSNTRWSEVLFITTVAHEHGHALGFDHQRDSRALMYPSITQASMARRGAPNASDLAEARRKGYRLRGGSES